jgi:hypothetical protein
VTKVPEAEQCGQRAPDPDDGTELACWLRGGHGGPHYDLADNVTWQVVVTPGEPG